MTALYCFTGIVRDSTTTDDHGVKPDLTSAQEDKKAGSIITMKVEQSKFMFSKVRCNSSDSTIIVRLDEYL